MAKPIPRQRKHKARARSKQNPQDDNANALELLPSTSAEQNVLRQRRRAEFQAQQPPAKLSSKKKRRLDKYIDTKLRKEENLEFIKKLSATTVDTGLLRSSKTLGRVRDTKRQALAQALRERRAGIESSDQDEVLFEIRKEAENSDDLSPESDADVDTPRHTPPAPAPSSSTSVGALGSGLKRPLEVDDSGVPIIQQRKRFKPNKTKHQTIEAGEESDFAGFSSSSEISEGRAALSPNLEAEEDTRLCGSQNSSDDNTDASEMDDEDEKDSDPSAESDSSSPDEAAVKERSTMFKAWATKQRNEAIGFVPSTAAVLDVPSSTHPMPGRQQPVWKPGVDLAGQAITECGATRNNTFSVTIDRPREIEETRLELPVVAKEQEIMEAVTNNDCVVVTGATGSGKTTQVPQFLFEAGYARPDGPTPGMIGITQPRRVAAVSMAKRVAFEMGRHGDQVSHQVRFDSSVSIKTGMKFMTDGVLLREISQDFVLSKYSAIVIDEAHERSVNTDILIGMLSRIVDTRAQLAKRNGKSYPLKLIIMSATLRISDFTMNRQLFRSGPPPVIEAEGKSYDVTVHFSRKTHREYVEDVCQKVCRGHRKLPPGGMLVFLTGQNEIEQVERRLKDCFEVTSDTNRHPKMHVSARDADLEAEDIDLGNDKGNADDDASDSDVSIHGLDGQRMTGDDDGFDVEPEEAGSIQKVHVLPLYSQLPSDLQMRVFEQPPDGSRMIVLSTNVAETSLTIPNIRYVFDCGRAKEKSYDLATGVESFTIDWISKSSAEQRRGRAGRTGPGHCYRLYSSAVYENYFAEHALPEIQRTPVEGVVLQLKSMGIPNIARFPFPTPPERASLLKAERLLEHLGALSSRGVTDIGRQLAQYPLSPRLARILIAASTHNCVSHAIAIVALLAVSYVFVIESQMNIKEPVSTGEDTRADTRGATMREQQRKEFTAYHGHTARNDRHSDAIKLLTALIDYTTDPTSITIRHHARLKALQEATQLRLQLAKIVKKTHESAGFEAIASLNPSSSPSIPTHAQTKTLRSLVAAGYIDQIAQRADASPTPPLHSRKPTRATDVPYITLFRSHDEKTTSKAMRSSAASHDKGVAVAAERACHVFIHPSSVLAHVSVSSLPQYLVYSHLSRASAPTITTTSTTTSNTPHPALPRTRMHPLTPLTAAQILQLTKTTPLLAEGKPVGRIETLPRSKHGEERRQCWTVPFLKGDVAGGREWPLPPARRVVQRREGERGWVVEE